MNNNVDTHAPTNVKLIMFDFICP